MPRKLDKIYNNRIKKYSALVSKTESKSRNISVFRLLVFVAGIVSVYYFAQQNSAAGISLSIFISLTVFLFLIRLHTKTIERKKLEKAFLTINKNELKAIKGIYDHFRNGEEYVEPDHPYNNDLDIFGEGSLFQFLNRTATITGFKKLAMLLSDPLQSNREIKDTQYAVDELSEYVDWRQRYQAIGLASKEGSSDREKIIEWSASKPLFQGLLIKILVVVIPLLTIFMILMLSLGEISAQVFFVYLVIPWGFSGSFAAKVNSRHNKVSKTSEMLTKYALLLHEIENLDVKTNRLKKLKQEIYRGDLSAGQSIKSLSAILNALDNRLNFISWALLNGLLVWDILLMIRLELWQKRHKQDLTSWFDVIAEYDVINCFANYRYNHEYAVFPELTEKQFEIYAEQAGHPLINAEIRVDNDIHIKQGEFNLITGANMAGKSTYLRTIGVNLVLAMCGAPVCAKQFRFSPIRIFTSIRTRDSLKENESYFYAELKRLKAIIDELRKGNKLFIILDEILKGTNSKDKHSGSEALLQQLISFHTCGVVATHDVLLGKLSERFPANIRNYCFEVDIRGDQLNFNYLLRNGVSKNLNATILMREMGITI